MLHLDFGYGRASTYLNVRMSLIIPYYIGNGARHVYIYWKYSNSFELRQYFCQFSFESSSWNWLCLKRIKLYVSWKHYYKVTSILDESVPWLVLFSDIPGVTTSQVSVHSSNHSTKLEISSLWCIRWFSKEAICRSFNYVTRRQCVLLTPCMPNNLQKNRIVNKCALCMPL
jgi:hypothetical protein